jgi:hypothetical protein
MRRGGQRREAPEVRTVVQTEPAASSVPPGWWSPSSHPDDGWTSPADYQPARTGGRCRRAIRPVSGGTFGTVGGGSTSPAPPRQRRQSRPPGRVPAGTARGPGWRTVAAGPADRGWPAGPRPPRGRRPAGTGWTGRPGEALALGRHRRGMAQLEQRQVVKTMICHGQPHQEAEAVQQPQRRLLGLADGDIHGEQANKRCDPEHDAHPPDMFRSRWAPSVNRPMVNVTSPPSARRASPCRCVSPEGRKDPYLCRNPVP